MLGSFSQATEPDPGRFSCQPVNGINVVSNLENDFAEEKSTGLIQSSILLWALLISLVIHSVLLSSNFVSITRENRVIPPQSQPIHIELQGQVGVSVLPPEVMASRVDQSVPGVATDNPGVEEPVSMKAPKGDDEVLTEKIIRDKSTSPSDLTNRPHPFIPVTPDELRSLQDAPVYSMEPSDAELERVDSKPFGGVFDPRLRKKLQDQQLTRRARETGLSVYELSNGASVVKLGDNHCMSTISGGKKEDATNWYHTNCGEKTEGEQIMDRVNKSLRMRQK